METKIVGFVRSRDGAPSRKGYVVNGRMANVATFQFGLLQGR